MPICTPYLTFQGQAQEALDFYRGVFGGELSTMTFASMGMTEHEGAPIPADWLMHGQLSVDAGFTLMASDTPPGMEQGQTPNGHVALSGPELDVLTRWFEGLAEGGSIDVPLMQAPWGDHFGQVKDRFGVNWLVNAGTGGA